MAECNRDKPGVRAGIGFSDPSGELFRHVVLPAGNLQNAIKQHLDENGPGLDQTTLHLLAATRDILGDISRKGAHIAIQPELQTADT
ncbi:MAG: hypothetical protein AAGD47_16115 [Pseudomonadota bacterium]